MSVSKFDVKRCGDYVFASRYWDRSNAWGHECYLLRDYGEVASAKVRYYNRTWEAYTYQTVMREALEKYAEQELKRFLKDKKITLGLIGFERDNYKEYEKPFRRGEKAKYIEEFKKSKDGQQIEALRRFVQG